MTSPDELRVLLVLLMEEGLEHLLVLEVELLLLLLLLPRNLTHHTIKKGTGARDFGPFIKKIMEIIVYLKNACLHTSRSGVYK